MKQRYSYPQAPLPTFNEAADPETLIEIAEGIHDESDKRRGVVIDKCKTLLALSSLLLPLLLAVSTQIRWPILFLIPAVFVFATAYLVMAALDVGSDQKLSISQVEVGLSKDALHKVFARSYLCIASYNDLRTDYLVDVMRAARWSLVWGLLTLSLVAMLGLTFLRKPDATQCYKCAHGDKGQPAIKTRNLSEQAKLDADERTDLLRLRGKKAEHEKKIAELNAKLQTETARLEAERTTLKETLDAIVTQSETIEVPKGESRFLVQNTLPVGVVSIFDTFVSVNIGSKTYLTLHPGEQCNVKIGPKSFVITLTKISKESCTFAFAEGP